MLTDDEEENDDDESEDSLDGFIVHGSNDDNDDDDDDDVDDDDSPVRSAGKKYRINKRPALQRAVSAAKRRPIDDSDGSGRGAHGRTLPARSRRRFATHNNDASRGGGLDSGSDDNGNDHAMVDLRTPARATTSAPSLARISRMAAMSSGMLASGGRLPFGYGATPQQQRQQQQQPQRGGVIASSTIGSWRGNPLPSRFPAPAPSPAASTSDTVMPCHSSALPSAATAASQSAAARADAKPSTSTAPQTLGLFSLVAPSPQRPSLLKAAVKKDPTAFMLSSPKRICDAVRLLLPPCKWKPKNLTRYLFARESAVVVTVSPIFATAVCFRFRCVLSSCLTMHDDGFNATGANSGGQRLGAAAIAGPSVAVQRVRVAPCPCGPARRRPTKGCHGVSTLL